MTAILEIEGLEISSREGAVVRDVSLRVETGEILCVVGESGCGKSLTALSVLDLLPRELACTGGVFRFAGEDVSAPEKRRRLRGKRVGMIFQEPALALNPVYTIGYQIREMLGDLPRGQRGQFVASLLGRVGLDPQVAGRYPHELSGGMKQRAMLAIALAGRPQLLLCDEPTTALDPTVGALILAQLRNLAREDGMAVLLITHDMHAVRRMPGRLAVLYAGVLVESGPIAQVLQLPGHPYTHALLQALPEPGKAPRPIPGQVPPPRERPPGCPFFNRCERAEPLCESTLPPLSGEKGRFLRCHHPMLPT